MTPKATKMLESLTAYVKAIDELHEHQRKHPKDSRGLSRIAARVDSAGENLPNSVAQTIMIQLSDSAEFFETHL